MNTTEIFDKVINNLDDKTLASIVTFPATEKDVKKSQDKPPARQIRKQFKKLFSDLPGEEKSKYVRLFVRTHFFASDKTNFQKLTNFFQLHLEKGSFEKLNSIDNSYEKVFQLISGRNELTEQAYKIAYKHNSRKFWNKRNDYYQKISITKDSLALFKVALSNMLKEKEIRGSDCVEELIEFEDKDYIFFTLSDIPQEMPVFEDGKINNSFKTPAFSIAIIFDHKNKGISVAADSSDTKIRVHQLFAKELLKKEIEPKAKNNSVYNTQKVLEHYIIHGQVTPKNEYKLISNIEIKKLRLKLKWYGFAELSVDVTQGKPQDTIFKIIKRFIRKSNEQSPQYFNLQDVLATGAEFFVTHRESKDSNTELEKTFSINSYGNANLGISAIDDEIRDYLSDMGFLKRNEQQDN